MTLGDLEHARVHPKFLHSNATSHKWAFGGKVSSALIVFHGLNLLKLRQEIDL